MRDTFYQSRAWCSLRAVRLRMDDHQCQAAGCISRAVTVDHVVARKQGGSDDLSNLRSLCDRHDRSVQEAGPTQARARGGVFVGCDASGTPSDPAHPWNQTI
jgi:5-methylcytosine-specific restriction endonuclease McrA